MSIRSGNPDFFDLPWEYPLEDWKNHSHRIEKLPRGLSRHPVEFISYDGGLYAVKELPENTAE